MKKSVIILFLLSQGPLPAWSQHGSIEQAFKDPPESARPRTWWHWTGGNVTREGITKDLEWMQRVGIAGFQLADVNFGGGQAVANPLQFGSDEWLDAVHHAALEAERLGLEMSIFSSAGWSLAGGPWVKPEQAMKKLVWSKATIEGPLSFSGELPMPPSGNGPIRNLSTGGQRDRQPADPEYYHDQVVLAFPALPGERDMKEFRPVFNSGTGPVERGGVLTDDDLNSGLALYRSREEDLIRLEIEFPEPYPSRAMTIAASGGIPTGRLLAENDDGTYRTLLSLPGTQNYRGGRVRTLAFPFTESRHYRLEITAGPMTPGNYIIQADPSPADSVILSEFVLHSGGRIHRWEDKAGFSLLNSYGSVVSPHMDEDYAVPYESVIDLTREMDEEGILQWEVPRGSWTVLRMGYSLTGAKNRPAMPSGSGYEVDKLNEEHTLDYIGKYMGMLRGVLGPLYGSSLRYVLLDSWEAGMQNWTDDMIGEFAERRGYNPLPYLPSLAGYVVQSPEMSDRFLWDFRRTLADMFAQNFYGTIADFLHDEGLGTYGEASGVSLEILEDALLCKKYMDIPMGEFWVRDLHPTPLYYADVRGAGSSAHIYGKKLVAAEAFTGGGYESPANLKRVSDYWFTQGINRLVFHTSAHQPLDSPPGNVMVGTHLHRNITWAELAGPFMDYLSRNSFMLQQGVFVADLVYLLDEGAPSTMPFWGPGLQPDPPAGYDYDYINADVLLNRMSVDDSGNLILPGGMRYKVLVLPNSDQMTLQVLEKIHELVRSGATVVGPKVTGSPSLADYPDPGYGTNELAADLWADLDGITRTRNYFGRGLVVWGEPPSQVLELVNVPPDVAWTGGRGSGLSWIHRRTEGMDIYFLASQDKEPASFSVRFRAEQRDVEFWHPGDGSIEPAGYVLENGSTRVPVNLEGYGSVFVVFRGKADSSRLPVETRQTLLVNLQGPWELSFPPGLGAPRMARLQELASWTEHADEGIRYFSGSATYSKTIEVPAGWLKPGSGVFLDLGQVRDIAEVSVNGRKLPVLWKQPYRIGIGECLEPGTNLLEITVTNQWTNRIIGDRMVEEGKRILGPGGGMMFGRPEPEESGLIGPVKIISMPQ